MQKAYGFTEESTNNKEHGEDSHQHCGEVEEVLFSGESTNDI